MAFRSPEDLECETAEVLAKLYNLSLQTAAVPEDWGAASVIPNYKKGSRGDPGNNTTKSHATRNGRELWIFREVLTVGKGSVASENENPTAQSHEVLWSVNKEGLTWM